MSSCVGTLQTTDFSIVSVEGVLVSGYFFLEPKLAYSLPWYTFALLPSWSGFIVSDFLAPLMRQQIGRRAKFRSSLHLQDNKAASALAVSLYVKRQCCSSSWYWFWSNQVLADLADKPWHQCHGGQGIITTYKWDSVPGASYKVTMPSIVWRRSWAMVVRFWASSACCYITIMKVSSSWGQAPDQIARRYVIN